MLTITNMRKTFNKGTVDEKETLNGVSPRLNPGDFVTMIGGNGTGKSTMPNMVTGVYFVDYGKIKVDGVNISRELKHRRAKYIGRALQGPMRGMAAGMRIQRNLTLVSRRRQIRGLGWGIKSSEKELYRDSLAELGLELQTRISSKVELLFGGQRQALTLLMATLERPKLLPLDERTAALNPRTAKKVLELTEEIINEQPLTALMVIHNTKDMIQMGNRLVMMHDGRIVYDMARGEKKKLQVDNSLKRLKEASGEEFANDRVMLAK